MSACGVETPLSGSGSGVGGTEVENAGEHPGPAEVDETDAFFAEGTLYDFHLSLPPDTRASLAAAPTTWVPATFSAEDQTYPVMVRLKGTTTFRPLSGKAAFKIDVHATDPTVRFHGLKRLTLNSMLQDSSMLHEHVAYWLFRHRGLPAPRHTYARLDVDGEPYGLYGVVETMDEQLLDHDLPDDKDGNLYEANLADFTVKGANNYMLEESGGVFEPTTDIEALAASLDASDDLHLVDALADGFNLDALFDYLAIDLVSGNVDGYSRLRNNYMAYHGTEGWRIFPWGYDQSFQFHRGVVGNFEASLPTRCQKSTECSDLLYGAVEDLMDDWQKGEFVAMASAEAGLIQADCRTDPRAELPCDVGHVVPFILDRPGTVAADLAK